VTGLGSRFATIRDSIGPLCIGIDPSSDVLARWGLPDSAEGALELGLAVVSAAAERVGIIKPQVAFFERFGSAGFAALETVIRVARSEKLAVIADAKRGDVGTTMQAYATAWLASGPLQSDALTVSPFQGLEALEPACELADESGATVFVLCATSNPDAGAVQSATVGQRSLPSAIAAFARGRSNASCSVGLVVGATRPLVESGLTVGDIEGTLLLAPGFGAQGARLSDITALFGAASATVIPSVSRSVLESGPTGIGTAIDQHRRELGL
jgi:orotidine-5'-phosphate decarboxylase